MLSKLLTRNYKIIYAFARSIQEHEDIYVLFRYIARIKQKVIFSPKRLDLNGECFKRFRVVREYVYRLSITQREGGLKPSLQKFCRNK